ncbi:MAG: FkbM family methyltransferase [Selenomonadaceae bacterium]|nr:FkbM family methyltransferase [Selenomonadaceae bacterium]
MFVCATETSPWQGEFDVPVLSIDEVNEKNRPKTMLMIYSYGLWWPEAVSWHFNRLGIRTSIIASADMVSGKANLFIANLPRIQKIYSMFHEESSKRAFCGALLGLVTEQIDGYEIAPEAQYMLRGFMPGVNDIAIDGGSLNGATAVDFASLGADVYSFEMDEDNFKMCLETAKKHNFTMENYGLWSKKESLSYSKAGGASRVTAGADNNAKFIDLDTYLSEKNLPRLDYLKLDIEGAELDALSGAAKSIRKWKPKMAISVYHKLDDIWRIPEYILSLRSDYQFEFRHYPTGLSGEAMNALKKYDISEMPVPWELILYCR